MSGKIDLGLDRMHALMSKLNHPERNLTQIIHVAGTNGKGSVCAFLSSILAAAGYKTGRFNSPHFLTLEDSIVINQQPINRERFDFFRNRVLECNHGVDATFFEIMTATAFLIFQEMQVDVVVLEVGMGGRLDATNVCSSPLVAVLTSIGLDHTEFLGKTIPLIAREKCGIIKPGTRSVVVAPQKDANVKDIVLETASDICSVHFASSAIVKDNQNSWATVSVLGDHVDFPISLQGAHQLENAATAILAIKTLAQVAPQIQITNEHIVTGMKTVSWPGRLEIRKIHGRDFILDGAHNVQGALQLGHFLKEHLPRKNTRKIWLVGFTASKDARGILAELVSDGDIVIATQFTAPEGMAWIQAMSQSAIKESVESLGREVTFFADSLDKAVAIIGNIPDATAIVCGSLYLIADFYRSFVSSS